MADAEELEALADTVAAGPKQVSADGISATSQSLAELDDHIDRKRGREAAAAGRLGVSFFKTSPPGAT